MIRNYMEDVVEHYLPSILNKYDSICKCEKCTDDIKALTLNQLKPQYISTEKGLIYSKINEIKIQFNADIVNEIVKSIEIISKNPKHDIR